MAALNSAVGLAAPPNFIVALAVLISYPLFKVIYNLFFHPLRKFPGPKIWAATRLTFIRSTLQGGLARDTWKLHEKYGDVVRITPDELSFARPEAFDDILATHQGRPPFPKNPLIYAGRPGQVVDDIGTAFSPAAHRRLRKAFDHAFTERSLLGQESVIKRYVDLLIQRLTDEALSEKSKSCVVDMYNWYTFTTFDILGALGFGESFNCLENKALHPWIERIFGWIKALSFVSSTKYFPILDFALQKAIPESLLQEQRDHFKFATDKIRRRLNNEPTHEDFFTSILASKEGKSLSEEEIEETAHVLMLAGSDTTATTLCGITVYLLKNLNVQRKLAAEVRGAFHSAEEITLTSTKNLQYLHGVVQEGLRICNPVPFLMSRIVPEGGGTVCGHWLPEGTKVIPHGRATGISPKFWARPLDFAPERWLNPPLCPAEFEADVRAASRPFSTGPRNCVGKNMAMGNLRLIIARLVWSFDLEIEGEPIDWFAQDNYFAIVKAPVITRVTTVRE